MGSFISGCLIEEFDIKNRKNLRLLDVFKWRCFLSSIKKNMLVQKFELGQLCPPATAGEFWLTPFCVWHERACRRLQFACSGDDLCIPL